MVEVPATKTLVYLAFACLTVSLLLFIFSCLDFGSASERIFPAVAGLSVCYYTAILAAQWCSSRPLTYFTTCYSLAVPAALAVTEIVGFAFFIAIFTWSWPVGNPDKTDFPDLQGIATSGTVVAEAIIAIIHNGLLWTLFAKGLIVRREIARTKAMSLFDSSTIAETSTMLSVDSKSSLSYYYYQS